jgi:hypothetical protein
MVPCQAKNGVPRFAGHCGFLKKIIPLDNTKNRRVFVEIRKST